MRGWRWVTLGVAAIVAGASVARAGTIRDDRADSLYTALAADYPSVGRVFANYGGTNTFTGSGVLIADGWVLTAGHVVHDDDFTLAQLDLTSSLTAFQFANGNTILGSAKKFAKVIVEPGWLANTNLNGGNDLALIRLTSLVTDAAPAVRWTGSLTGELGQTGTLVGYGRTGTGLTGSTLISGTKRAGHNVIDATANQVVGSWSANTLMLDFDDPPGGTEFANHTGSNTSLNLEYITAPGDSGGGLFIDVAGSPQVVGILSYGASFDGSTNSSYGDLAGYTRIAPFNSWIDSVLAANADTMTWNAGNSTFNTAGNWTSPTLGATVPGSLDTARFDSAAARTVTFNSHITNAGLIVRRNAVTLNLAGFTYRVTGAVALSQNPGQPLAQLVVSNGTLDAAAVTVGGASSGRLTLQSGGAVTASTVTVQTNGSITGVGTITANVINHGSISPGTSPGSSPGTLAIAGNYAQTVTGSLVVELASLASFDKLTVTGSAALAGALQADLLSGYTPGVGDTFTFLTAASVTGAFTFTSPVFNDIFYFLPQYTATSAFLTVAYAQITGDANNDGVVDAADFLAVENNLGSLATLSTPTGLLFGDANDDGRVDGRDLLAIEQHFGAAWSGPTPIPEPAAVALVGVGAGVLGRKRFMPRGA